MLATLPSALAEANRTFSPRFALLCGLIGIHLAICWFGPVRGLRFWVQLASLTLQVATASLAHLMMPSQLLGYIYLVIVLQAVYLFKPLLWILFAGWVYIIWSGSLMIASASLLDRRLERLVVGRLVRKCLTHLIAMEQVRLVHCVANPLLGLGKPHGQAEVLVVAESTLEWHEAVCALARRSNLWYAAWHVQLVWLS